jgi:hypothetical protein
LIFGYWSLETKNTEVHAKPFVKINESPIKGTVDSISIDVI